MMPVTRVGAIRVDMRHVEGDVYVVVFPTLRYIGGTMCRVLTRRDDCAQDLINNDLLVRLSARHRLAPTEIARVVRWGVVNFYPDCTVTSDAIITSWEFQGPDGAGLGQCVVDFAAMLTRIDAAVYARRRGFK